MESEYYEPQYEILNILDNLITRLAYPQNTFTRILITNTSTAVAPVTVDLFVEDPPNIPTAGTVYYILHQVIIPAGASLEIGKDQLAYFSDNRRQLKFQSSNVGGDVTILIRK
tara:strand:- start:32903 stop:33241 length:339 start_codon:yes stop_codon:yes gene_type:complete